MSECSFKGENIEAYEAEDAIILEHRPWKAVLYLLKLLTTLHFPNAHFNANTCLPVPATVVADSIRSVYLQYPKSKHLLSRAGLKQGRALSELLDCS